MLPPQLSPAKIPWLAKQGGAYVAALTGLGLLVVPLGSAGHVPLVGGVPLHDSEFIGSLASGSFLIAVSGVLRVYAAAVVSKAELEQLRLNAEMLERLIVKHGKDVDTAVKTVKDIMAKATG